MKRIILLVLLSNHTAFASEGQDTGAFTRTLGQRGYNNMTRCLTVPDDIMRFQAHRKPRINPISYLGFEASDGHTFESGINFTEAGQGIQPGMNLFMKVSEKMGRCESNTNAGTNHMPEMLRGRDRFYIGDYVCLETSLKNGALTLKVLPSSRRSDGSPIPETTLVLKCEGFKKYKASDISPRTVQGVAIDPDAEFGDLAEHKLKNTYIRFENENTTAWKDGGSPVSYDSIRINHRLAAYRPGLFPPQYVTENGDTVTVASSEGMREEGNPEARRKMEEEIKARRLWQENNTFSPFPGTATNPDVQGAIAQLQTSGKWDQPATASSNASIALTAPPKPSREDERKAQAEAKREEEARKRAEAEEKRKAEAEERKLAEEKRLAEEQRKQAAEEKKQAEAQALVLAKQKAEEEKRKQELAAAQQPKPEVAVATNPADEAEARRQAEALQLLQQVKEEAGQSADEQATEDETTAELPGVEADSEDETASVVPVQPQKPEALPVPAKSEQAKKPIPLKEIFVNKTALRVLSQKTGREIKIPAGQKFEVVGRNDPAHPWAFKVRVLDNKGNPKSNEQYLISKYYFKQGTRQLNNQQVAELLSTFEDIKKQTVEVTNTPVGEQCTLSEECQTPTSSTNGLLPDKEAQGSAKLAGFDVYPLNNYSLIQVTDRKISPDDIAHCRTFINGTFYNTRTGADAYQQICPIYDGNQWRGHTVSKTLNRGYFAKVRTKDGKVKVVSSVIKPGDFSGPQYPDSIKQFLEKKHGGELLSLMGGGGYLVDNNGAEVSSETLESEQGFNQGGSGFGSDQMVSSVAPVVAMKNGQSYIMVPNKGMTGKEMQTALKQAGYSNVVRFDAGGSTSLVGKSPDGTKQYNALGETNNGICLSPK